MKKICLILTILSMSVFALAEENFDPSVLLQQAELEVLKSQRLNETPAQKRQRIAAFTSNVVKRFGRDSLGFYLAGNILQSALYYTPGFRNLSNPGFVQTEIDHLSEPSGHVHFLLFIATNSLLSESTKDYQMKQALLNRSKGFNLKGLAIRQGIGNGFLAISSVVAELGSAGYSWLHACSLSNIWLSAEASIERQATGYVGLKPSEKLSYIEQCDYAKKHFPQRVAHSVFASVPALVSGAMLSTAIQSGAGLALSVGKKRLIQSRFKNQLIETKNILKKPFKKMQKYKVAIKKSTGFIRLSLHFTVFLASIEAMNQLFGEELGSKVQSWFYDKAENELKNLKKQGNLDTSQSVQVVREFQDANQDWLDHIASMALSRRGEWDHDLIRPMRSADFARKTYAEILSQIYISKNSQNNFYKTMDHSPLKEGFPSEYLRGVLRLKLSQTQDPSLQPTHTSLCLAKLEANQDYKITNEVVRSLMPVWSEARQTFFSDYRARKSGVDQFCKDDNTFISFANPSAQSSFQIENPDISETECRVKVAREYLRSNLCRWRGKSIYNTHKLSPDKDKPLVNLDEMKDLQKKLDSSEKQDWRDALAQIEKLQSNTQIFKHCKATRYFSAYCLIYELNEILDYPMVQSKMKLAFQGIDDTLILEQLGDYRETPLSTVHVVDSLIGQDPVSKGIYDEVKNFEPFSRDYRSGLSSFSRNALLSEKLFLSMLCGHDSLDSLQRIAGFRGHFSPPRVVEQGDFCKRLYSSIKEQEGSYDFNKIPSSLINEGVTYLENFTETLEQEGYGLEGCNDIKNGSSSSTYHTEIYIEKRFMCWWRLKISEQLLTPFFEKHFADYTDILKSQLSPVLFQAEGSDLVGYSQKEERRQAFHSTFKRYQKAPVTISLLREVDVYMDYVLKPIYEQIYINHEQTKDTHPNSCFENFEKYVNLELENFIEGLNENFHVYEDEKNLKEYVCSSLVRKDKLPQDPYFSLEIKERASEAIILGGHLDIAFRLLFENKGSLEKELGKVSSQCKETQKNGDNFSLECTRDRAFQKLSRCSANYSLDPSLFPVDAKGLSKNPVQENLLQVRSRIHQSLIRTLDEYRTYLDFNAFKNFNDFIKDSYCRKLPELRY